MADPPIRDKMEPKSGKVAATNIMHSITITRINTLLQLKLVETLNLASISWHTGFIRMIKAIMMCNVNATCTTLRTGPAVIVSKIFGESALPYMK